MFTLVWTNQWRSHWWTKVGTPTLPRPRWVMGFAETRWVWGCLGVLWGGNGVGEWVAWVSKLCNKPVLLNQCERFTVWQYICQLQVVSTSGYSFWGLCPQTYCRGFPLYFCGTKSARLSMLLEIGIIHDNDSLWRWWIINDNLYNWLTKFKYDVTSIRWRI